MPQSDEDFVVEYLTKNGTVDFEVIVDALGYTLLHQETAVYKTLLDLEFAKKIQRFPGNRYRVKK